MALYDPLGDQDGNAPTGRACPPWPLRRRLSTCGNRAAHAPAAAPAG